MDQTPKMGLRSWLSLFALALGIVACADSPTSPTDGADDSGIQDPQCQGQEDGASCDDGEPCTVGEVCTAGVCGGGGENACDGATGCQIGSCIKGLGCQYLNKVDGVLCESGCFNQAFCQSGQCVPDANSAIICPPAANPCVKSLECDVALGECSIEIFVPVGGQCDADGDLCTLDQCDGTGSCTFGQMNSCESEAQGSCWNYKCVSGEGCVTTAFNLGVSCDDDNGCTFTDTCVSEEVDGKATEFCKGTPVAVDDQNPCTDDGCSSGVVFHQPLDGAQCPTDDPCASGGICAGGVCEPIGACECTVDQDCPEQMNLCAGVSFCNKNGQSPKCDILPGTSVECGDSGSPCTALSCNVSTGLCAQEELVDGTACDDGDPCTKSTLCVNVGCVGGDTIVCDDGEYCNGLESCVNGDGCESGVMVALDDGIPCTADACDEDSDSVTHTPIHAVCDDGKFCNGFEYCDLVEGCQFGVPPELDDDISCTLDSCDENTNLVTHVVDHSACDDGDICDGTEICHPGQGCIHDPAQALPDGVICNDGDACTVGDACQAQKCVSQVLSCDDNNPCTVSSCDSKQGCLYQSIADSTPCFDGNPCTVTTLCADGQCVGGSPLPDSSPCDDGNQCTTTSHCESGKCTVVDTQLCDDGNECTADNCDPKKGCVYVPDEGPCEDDDLCTLTGTCSEGQCTSIKPKECLAPDDCHLDGECMSDSGECVFPNQTDSTLCDDGDACTSPDVCLLGVCNGAPIVCDDGNACTVDSCGNQSGCLFSNVPDGGACNDGNPCTAGSSCTVGICDGGTTLPDGSACSDGNECSAGSVCIVGTCSGGTPLDCNDDNPCTQDSCDGQKGCKHAAIVGPCSSNCWCANGNCAALDDGYSVDWTQSYAHPLSTPPEGSYFGNSPLAPQGPGLVGGVTAWKQDANWNAFWIPRDSADETLWAGEIQFYRPSHAKLRYSIVGSPGVGLYDSESGLELWVNTVEQPFEPAIIELVDKGNGLVLAQITHVGTVNQWTTVRAELNSEKNTVKVTVGETEIGPLSVDPVSMLGSQIGLSAYANCCELAGVGWRLLHIETGISSTSVAAECSVPVCGDGLINTPGEKCDDGNIKAGDGCSGTCKEEAMVLIPKGPGWQGCKSALDVSCTAVAEPAHEVYLTAYYMGRLEVTVEQFKACVDAGICNGNVSNDGTCNYGKAGREQHPMNCVSWQDATVFCAWKGQLLPSEAQWERAARGGCELFTSQECATVFPKYPWGNGGVTCDLAAISGCGESSTGSHQVGTHPAGVSPYGVYDMAGNVAEWTRDWYSPFYYSMSPTINPIGPAVGTERSVRGSSYLANVFGSSTLLALWFRESMAPDEPQAQIGFRCVKSAN